MKKLLIATVAAALFTSAEACPKFKQFLFAGQAKAELALQPVCDSGALTAMKNIQGKTGAKWVEVYRFVTEKDGKIALDRALKDANYQLAKKEVDGTTQLLTYKAKVSKRVLMIMLEKKGSTTFLFAFQ